jgi:hypothetical protein
MDVTVDVEAKAKERAVIAAMAGVSRSAPKQRVARP